MIAGDFLRATVYATQEGASNPIINTYDWRLVTLSATATLQVDGGFIASAIVERYFVPLADALSTQYSIYQISLRLYADPDEGYDATGTLFTGGISGNVCPPFLTYSIRKQRNNYAMRNGRWSYGGVPRAAIGLNGTPEAAIEALIDGWGAGVRDTRMLVEGDLADMEFEDLIVRKPSVPNTNPSVFSRLTGVTLSGFGTMNTRKS